MNHERVKFIVTVDSNCFNGSGITERALQAMGRRIIIAAKGRGKLRTAELSCGRLYIQIDEAGDMKINNPDKSNFSIYE